MINICKRQWKQYLSLFFTSTNYKQCVPISLQALCTILCYIAHWWYIAHLWYIANLWYIASLWHMYKYMQYLYLKQKNWLNGRFFYHNPSKPVFWNHRICNEILYNCLFSLVSYLRDYLENFVFKGTLSCGFKK